MIQLRVYPTREMARYEFRHTVNQYRSISPVEEVDVSLSRLELTHRGDAEVFVSVSMPEANLRGRGL